MYRAKRWKFCPCPNIYGPNCSKVFLCEKNTKTLQSRIYQHRLPGNSTFWTLYHIICSVTFPKQWICFLHHSEITSLVYEFCSLRWCSVDIEGTHISPAAVNGSSYLIKVFNGFKSFWLQAVAWGLFLCSSQLPMDFPCFISTDGCRHQTFIEPEFIFPLFSIFTVHKRRIYCTSSSYLASFPSWGINTSIACNIIQSFFVLSCSIFLHLFLFSLNWR